MYAKLLGLMPVYNSGFKYYESMYLVPIAKYSHGVGGSDEADGTVVDYKENLGNDHRINQAIPVMRLKKDLISHFNESCKNDFYSIVANIAKSRGYKLPWSDCNNVICIHLRLHDDRFHEGSIYPDYDGSASSKYISDQIDSGSFKYDMEEMKRYCKDRGCEWGVLKHPDKQCTIDINKLDHIMVNLKKDYPDKEIHVVTKLSKHPCNQKYIDLCNKYNVRIHSNKDYDYDLWLLIHCDILVLSKSTYSLIAGYYHQGSKVIYPLWGTFASCGLSTKYDKSGWESYI